MAIPAPGLNYIDSLDRLVLAKLIWFELPFEQYVRMRKVSRRWRRLYIDMRAWRSSGTYRIRIRPAPLFTYQAKERKGGTERLISIGRMRTLFSLTNISLVNCTGGSAITATIAAKLSRSDYITTQSPF